MKVQRVLIPGRDQYAWVVLDDDYLPVNPVCRFLAYLENLDRSPHTLRAYAQHLKQFWEYLRDVNVEWTAVELSHLSEFVARLRRPVETLAEAKAEPSARRSETTVNTILAAGTSFYEFQARLGEVQRLPLFRLVNGRHRSYKGFLHHVNQRQVSVNVLKLRAPKHVPRTLTAEQAQQLIAACERRRDRFLLCLLYETGIRIGQALGLRHADYLTNEYGEIESDYVFVNCWGADLWRRLRPKQPLGLFEEFRLIPFEAEDGAFPRLSDPVRIGP